jgi:glutamyl-tRNA synthetase
MEVKTRFAPSPTGYMHVGGVRTALFAWLVAKQAGGKFILRIEDTDKAREVAGSEDHIMECLKWLGLGWDEGADKGGPSGPYRQSERLEIYRQWADKLIKAGRAYADPYSPRQLEELRQKAKAEKRPFLFRDHRPENPTQWNGQQPLRFKSEPKQYKWHDEVMGDLSTGPEAVDDYILIKSDGYPTYNFAHIVDDHLMGITHVIRSQEFLPSVPKFLNLYDALEIDWPKFATLPYVMAPDGNKKLSKRDGAKDILDYKKEGYLPEALISFLATLGWNDGTQQEIFSVQELIDKFDLRRVQKGGARFDEKRLIWTNGSFIRDLTLDQLTNRAESFWPEQAVSAQSDYKHKILSVVQERLKYLSELGELTDFFFTRPDHKAVAAVIKDPPDKQLAKLDQSDYKPMLAAASEALAPTNFEQDQVRSCLNRLLEKLGTKPGILFALIRLAVTAKSSSPELSGTLAVLGKDESLARLAQAIDILDA